MSRRPLTRASGVGAPELVPARTSVERKSSGSRKSVAAATAAVGGAPSRRSLKVPQGNLASVLSFLGLADARKASAAVPAFASAARGAVSGCEVVTGRDGQRCLVALRAAAPLAVLVTDEAEEKDEKDAEQDEAETALRAQLGELTRERLRALGPACLDRCSRLLAKRAVRGIKQAMREGDVQFTDVWAEFPGTELPTVAELRVAPERRGREGLAGVNGMTPAEVRHLTEAEVASLLTSEALAEEAATKEALYSMPHLGGELHTYDDEDGVMRLEVYVHDLTVDEVLLMAQSPAVMRAERVAKGGILQTFISRNVAGTVLQGLKKFQGVYIHLAPAQALAREVAERAVPPLKALLLAIAPYVSYVEIHSDDEGTVDTAAIAAHLQNLEHPRDDSRKIRMEFVAPVIDYQGYDATNPDADAAAEKRVAAMLPALAATAPSLVHEWIRHDPEAGSRPPREVR